MDAYRNRYKLQRIILLLISLGLGMSSHYFINLLFCFDCIFPLSHFSPRFLPSLALSNSEVIIFFAESVEYRNKAIIPYLPSLPAIFSNIFALHWKNAEKKFQLFQWHFSQQEYLERHINFRARRFQFSNIYQSLLVINSGVSQSWTNTNNNKQNALLVVWMPIHQRMKGEWCSSIQYHNQVVHGLLWLYKKQTHSNKNEKIYSHDK